MDTTTTTAHEPLTHDESRDLVGLVEQYEVNGERVFGVMHYALSSKLLEAWIYTRERNVRVAAWNRSTAAVSGPVIPEVIPRIRYDLQKMREHHAAKVQQYEATRQAAIAAALAEMQEAPK